MRDFLFDYKIKLGIKVGIMELPRWELGYWKLKVVEFGFYLSLSCVFSINIGKIAQSRTWSFPLLDEMVNDKSNLRTRSYILIATYRMVSNNPIFNYPWIKLCMQFSWFFSLKKWRIFIAWLSLFQTLWKGGLAGWI